MWYSEMFVGPNNMFFYGVVNKQTLILLNFISFFIVVTFMVYESNAPANLILTFNFSGQVFFYDLLIHGWEHVRSNIISGL